MSSPSKAHGSESPQQSLVGLESLGHDILVNYVFPYLSESDIRELSSVSSTLKIMLTIRPFGMTCFIVHLATNPIHLQSTTGQRCIVGDPRQDYILGVSLQMEDSDMCLLRANHTSYYTLQLYSS